MVTSPAIRGDCDHRATDAAAAAAAASGGGGRVGRWERRVGGWAEPASLRRLVADPELLAEMRCRIAPLRVPSGGPLGGWRGPAGPSLIAPPPPVPRHRARSVLRRDPARGAVAPPRPRLWVERAAMYTHGHVHVSFADEGEARTYTQGIQGHTMRGASSDPTCTVRPGLQRRC